MEACERRNAAGAPRVLCLWQKMSGMRACCGKATALEMVVCRPIPHVVGLVRRLAAPYICLPSCDT